MSRIINFIGLILLISLISANHNLTDTEAFTIGFLRAFSNQKLGKCVSGMFNKNDSLSSNTSLFDNSLNILFNITQELRKPDFCEIQTDLSNLLRGRSYKSIINKLHTEWVFTKDYSNKINHNTLKKNVHSERSLQSF